MAYDNGQGQSTFQKVMGAVSAGLEGGMEGYKFGMDMKAMQEQAENKRKELLQHQEQIDNERKAQEQQMQLHAIDSGFRLLDTSAKLASDPALASASQPYILTLANHMDQFNGVLGVQSNWTNLFSDPKQYEKNKGILDKINQVNIKFTNWTASDKPFQLSPQDAEALQNVENLTGRGSMAPIMQKIQDYNQQIFSRQSKERLKEASLNNNADLDKEARKELTNAENVITGVATRGTNSMFGQSAKRAFGGRLLDNMLDKLDNPNIPESEKLTATKQVAMTFARNFDSTISQGGSSAEFAQHMVPDSWEGTAKDFWQKASGKPQQYLTPEFLKNFANEIKVERETVSQDIGSMIQSKHDALAKTYGQKYADQFKETALTRFKNDKFAKGAIEKAFGANSNAPQVIRFQDSKGNQYDIPQDQVAIALKAHPDLKQVK